MSQVESLVDEFQTFSEASRQSQQETIHLMDTLLAQIQQGDSTSNDTLKSLQEKAKSLYTALMKTYTMVLDLIAYCRSKLTDKTKAFSSTSNLNDIWDPDTIKDLDSIIASYLIRGMHMCVCVSDVIILLFEYRGALYHV
jgi:hypothetical protein